MYSTRIFFIIGMNQKFELKEFICYFLSKVRKMYLTQDFICIICFCFVLVLNAVLRRINEKKNKHAFTVLKLCTGPEVNTIQKFTPRLEMLHRRMNPAMLVEDTL